MIQVTPGKTASRGSNFYRSFSFFDRRRFLKNIIQVFSIIFVLFPLQDGVFSQPVTAPQLNPQAYNWQQWQSQMQGTYSVANQTHDTTNWDAIVLQSYGVVQSEWQAQVQAQISSIVSGITTQDSFQSVQDYKNYVYDTLESQASGLLTQWQRDAEFSIQTQRNQYIDTYYGGNLTTVTNLKNQFDSEFQALIKGGSPNVTGIQGVDTSLLGTSQQSLSQLEQRWYSQFNSNIQNGLWNYEQGLQSLTKSYQGLLAQINQTESQYQAYLQQIQSYESGVKDQINQTIAGYQQFLNGNDLFWNTVTPLKDTSTGTAIAATCPPGDVCSNNYFYDTTSSQFVSSCPAGNTCVQLMYDTTTSSYVNPSCPASAASGCTSFASIHTSLNADGKAFQNLINNIETAITQGKTGLAIFDQSTSQMLSYPQSCLNTGEVCQQGWYDSTQQKFLTSASCPAGDTCYNAIVDATNAGALTGQYYSNTCPAGDLNCITCPTTGSTADTCHIQSMEISLVYAANAISGFLAQEIQNAQGQVALYQSGGSTNVDIQNGSFMPTPGNPFSQSPTLVYITRQDFLSGNASSPGAVGLAWNIVQYLQNPTHQAEVAFMNYLTNAYSASLSAGGSTACPALFYNNDAFHANDFNAACLAQYLSGFGPGSLVTGINSSDLTAFQDINFPGNTSGGINNWSADPAYCHDWLGCYGNIFTGDPAVIGANQTYSSNHTIAGAPGSNFYDYLEDESGCYGWPLICAVGLVQWSEDAIALNLNYTVSNFNSGANATTWQNLATQLQSFQYNWNQNVLPSVTNWTAQVSTFDAQYAAWHLQEQTLLAQAQSDYSTGLQNLQTSETTWLTQMNQLQTKANLDFASANSKLKSSQNQADAQLLSQELLGKLNFSSGTDISATPSSGANSGSLFSNVTSQLSGINPQAQYNSLNFGLLNSFSSSFNQAISGASNLTLLSSTNNALLNDRMNYMQQMATSLSHEKTFTQNGQDQLLRDSGNLSTKRGDDGRTYIVNQDGNYVNYCDPATSKCGNETIDQFLTSKCGSDLTAAACNGYTTLKYSNVRVDSAGNIQLDEAIYTGDAVGQGDNASNYNFTQRTQHITIGPSPAFLLGHGGGVGNIFDTNPDHHEGDRISEVIGASFAGVNNFFANGNYSNSTLFKLASYDALNSANETKASMSASSQAQTAGMVADFVENVFLGGMTTQQWVAHETHNLVQNAYTTFLVNAFHLSPEAASFLAGAYMDHEAYKAAEHNMGILRPIDNLLKNMFLDGGLLNGLVGLGIDITHADDLRAIHQWREDKYAAYGLIASEAMRLQNFPPDQIALVSQVVTDYFRMSDAKTELGMKGALLSVPRLEGMVHAMTASMSGALAEIEGVIVKNITHDLHSTGMISSREEQKFDKDLRYGINEIKLVYEKNAIKTWQADVVSISKDAVQLYGKQAGLDPAYVNQVADMVGNMVSREQARGELRKLHLLEDVLSVGGTALDRSLFKGGLSSMLMQVARGILTSSADIGRSFGLFTKSETKDFYKQTKDWSNSITGASLTAQSHQGDLDKHWWKEQERKLVFDLIGKAMDPNGDPAEQQLIGQLLQKVFDQREAKKQARRQRMDEAEQAVEVVAGVLLTAASGGSGVGVLAQVLEDIGNFINVADKASFVMDGLNAVKYGSEAVMVGSQTYVGYEEGGKNGAVAGFLNGLISVATIVNKLPITGFVSWTPHQNANILMGEEAKAGGWGGGISAALPGEYKLPINGGLTFTPGSGLDVNLNYNFHGGYVGLDYNLSSGNYTANGGMDVYKSSATNAHHLGLSLSASKDGSASVGAYYNYGKTSTPPNLRGSGGTFTYSNDGKFNLGGQVLGGTVASVSYDTNSHKFEKVQGNANWQNEMLLARVQENSSENYGKNLEKISDLAGQALSSNNIITESERLSMMNSPDGQQKILELYSQNKETLINGVESERVRGDMREIAEKNNLKLEYVKDSPTTEIGKTLARLGGDIKMMFGISDSGLLAVDKDGTFRVSSCFDGSQLILTPNGTRRIDSLKIGEEVNTLNEETGEVEVRKITETFVHDVKSIHKIGYENDVTVTTTWNHPFAVLNPGDRNQNSGVIGNAWVKAEDLKIGDRGITKRSIRRAKLKMQLSRSSVLSPASIMFGENSYIGEYKTNWQTEREGTLGIRKVEEFIHSQKVYNIELEGNHNYFIKVGNEFVVVHNYQVDVRLEKIPTDDLAMLSKPNSDPKYGEVKWGDKTYNRVIEKGIVHYESQGPNGSKEVIRVTSNGYIEHKTVWGGFMGLGARESKPSYFKANETNLAERNANKANGFKEEPLAPYEKAADSRYITDKLSKLWSEKGIDGSKHGFGVKELRQMNSFSKELTVVNHELEFTKANKSQVEGAEARIRKLETEKFRLNKELDKLYETAKTSYTKLGYESRDENGRYTGEFAKFNKEPREFGNSGQNTNLLMNEVSVKAQSVLGFKAGEPMYKARMQEIQDIVKDLANNRSTSRQNEVPREEWIRTATRALEDISQRPGESKEEFMERLNSGEAGAQDRTHGTAVQLTVAIELLQKAYAKGDLKPSIPHDAPDRAQRLENYNKFVEFVKRGWSPELGSKTAAEICRTYTNYLEAVDAKVTKASFVEWYTYKGISGDLGFSQGAPVVDLGHTPGFSKSWGVETEGSNDFGGVRLDPKTGELKGIVNPIPVDSLKQKLNEFPTGKVIQVYDDTNGTPGGNHYCLWLKTENGWVNYNHTGGYSGGAKVKELIPFDRRTKVYKIYY
ncbi:TIGR04388 family protein [Leptospira fainei]|nr:TIGR04388 family protein [Leptospira fainei]